MRPAFSWGLMIPVITLVMGVSGWAILPSPHTVVIHDVGRTVVVSGRKLHTVEDALTRAALTLRPNDQVVPDPATDLPKGSLDVTVLRAWPVQMVDGDTTRLRYTTARTVGDALAEWHVSLDASDRVAPPLFTPLAPDVTIRITRVRHRVSTEVVDVPFDTERHPDESLNEGEVRERQPGVPGRKEVTLQQTLVNGVVTGSDVVAERVIRQPQPRILAFGTVGVVSRGGESHRYVRSLNMVATGYTAGPESNPNGNGLTYTGIPARRGVVAVDPRVIPLGTRLYIEGYGTAVAADIGGAIKGDRIDLCFDRVSEADDWGMREVRVYVLAS